MRLLNHRSQRLLGSPTGRQESGEVAARTQSDCRESASFNHARQRRVALVVAITPSAGPFRRPQCLIELLERAPVRQRVAVWGATVLTFRMKTSCDIRRAGLHRVRWHVPSALLAASTNGEPLGGKGRSVSRATRGLPCGFGFESRPRVGWPSEPCGGRALGIPDTGSSREQGPAPEYGIGILVNR
jgi:hypothetical protein